MQLEVTVSRGTEGSRQSFAPAYPAGAGRPTEEPLAVLAETARSGQGPRTEAPGFLRGCRKRGRQRRKPDVSLQKARRQPAGEVPARRAPP